MNFAYIKIFIKALIQRTLSHDVPDLAAQLSFYFLLALFPFLIFTFALLAYIPISTADVLRFFSQYVPEQGMGVIERNVVSILEVQRGGVLSISFFIALWSASNASHAVMRALNHAYEVEDSRSFIHGRLVAILLTISLMVVIVIALLLPVFGKMLGVFLSQYILLPEDFLFIWDVFRLSVSFGVLFLIFCCLYYFAPNLKLKVRDVWVGALMATMGWQLTSLAFSFYINNFGNFTAMYGSLGGIVGLLLWFFLSGMILLVGGEINATRKWLQKG
ncbi:YihY/virulence factor BrkB family protein [Caldalkalibacillus salinus]|uniref:YihY/virulence factor BrkB family protein n=1 Tax=Caldalkalibacillus salinus TaxID=2803787 RepID=UPI001F375D8F|nr:YihY/virulence factor BrkB family protein [Caldalkalibacillus salinus]